MTDNSAAIETASAAVHSTAPVNTGPASRIACYLALAYSGIFSAVFITRLPIRVGGSSYFTLFDDAMISMRYAFNLAHGHGLVYNAGQHRVEGYTNLSWTLWMAALQSLGIPMRLVALPVMITSALLVLMTVYAAGAVVRRLAPTSRLARPIVMWLVALYYPLVYWSDMGMETGLLALLTLTAIVLAIDVVDGAAVADRNSKLSGLVAVLFLAVLTREDALIMSVVVVGFVGIRAGRRMAGLVAIGPVFAFVGHLLFSWIYYGSALPNTYYLKVSGVGLATRASRGVASLVSLGMWELWVPALLAIVYLVANRHRRVTAGCWMVSLIVVAQCAYVITVGGDAWEHTLYADRFMASVAPAVMIVAALAIAWIVEERALSLVQAGFIAAVVVIVGLVRAIPLQPGRTSLLITTNESAFWRDGVPLIFLLGSFAVFGALHANRHRQRKLVAVSAVALTGLVSFAIVGRDLDVWTKQNAFLAPLDGAFVRYGVALHRYTKPDTEVASSAAGSIAFFSERPVIDLLGKSDSLIAREHPKLGFFIPGHNKWDLGHSIGMLRPGVVAMLWPIPVDPNAVISVGYERVAFSAFVRNDAQGVDRGGLSSAARQFFLFAVGTG